MIATCHREHKTFCFVVKPSPGSRKSDIVGFQQIAEIDQMYFVSNQHILVRFKDSKTVTLRSNGTIVNQHQRVQEILDNQNASIVAATDVEFGKMFLTLFIVENNNKELRTLVFGSDGKAELIGIFNASKKSIKEKIKQDDQIKQLA